MDEPLVYLLWRQLQCRVAMFGRDKPLKASKREAHSKISIPLRTLADDQVDRRRVYAWQHVQLSRTNRPFVLSISIRLDRQCANVYTTSLTHYLFDEVALARRPHPFPFRTRPLSSSAPMVLQFAEE